jgi:hypothetical protein
MQVIASWTGAEANALQQAMRMTNESFADRLVLQLPFHVECLSNDGL